MPTLPPRNLPFSPSTTPNKGGPSTPSSAKSSSSKKGIASPGGSTTPTLLRDSGIVSRQEETTFHRKLRTLLWDHRDACERWQDIVSHQGAKAVAAFARSSAALDDFLGRKRQSDEGSSGILRLRRDEQEARHMEEMALVVQDLLEEKGDLDEAMIKLDKATSKLTALSNAAETLLIEATKSKGSDFTFEQEMWVTWSMERFVGMLQLVTSQHVLQGTQLQLLATSLAQDGCAPGQPVKTTAQEQARQASDREMELEAEDDDDDDDDDDDAVGRERRKWRAGVRQRVMEEWQKLPFLQGREADLLEDICEVEVGRWEDK